MDNERELPEGVIDANPAGGWDGVDDAETQEQSDAVAASAPEGPVESTVPTQGIDPDLATDDSTDEHTEEQAR
ncbi:hypothetical protein [Microbacterium sp. RU33B]|uniref:hypothetical protein n=1 Tax=Microbacterium sp. RU33B TaxID=1907390 RepID=UPI00095F3262|nr:hypothetical protein [Microbacterium sp. RU33B]SIT67660.1 hypothetical protein SAMN05880545_0216 [Microbacterium sp. RU33B]